MRVRCRYADNRTRRSPLGALIEEFVPVARLALQRDEQVARADFAGIEGDASRCEIGRRSAAGGRRDFG